ncbi:MAG: HdeD family acid-resistance protein [Geminicoccaceae bacterium]
MSTITATTPDILARLEENSALLADHWWALALRGLCGVLFGIVAFALPGVTMVSLVWLFAAYLLTDGVLAIVAGVRAARRRDRWGLLVLEGIANLIAGVLAFLWPGITVVALVLLTAAWAIVSGALMLGSAFRLTVRHGRWWMVASGVLSIVWGVLIAVFPIAGAVVLTWWIGAYALVFGVLLLALAFRLRSKRGQRAMAADVGIGSGTPRPTT